MKCVRCLEDTANKIAEAPDKNKSWEVFYCERCSYSWRTTEEDEITILEKRDPGFQLDKTDLDGLISPAPIPALKS